MKNKSYQTGLTLIEIMIALLIGAFLLGGVINIFLSSKQTYRMQEGLSRLQENGRFAMEFLSKDIRMAEFIGCNSDPSLITNTTTPAKTPNTLNTPTDFLYDFKTAIQGFEATSSTDWAPIISTAITSPLGDSDVITIRRAGDQSFTVTAHASNTADLTLDATATVANLQAAGFLTTAATPANSCTIAVVSNCSKAAVFQVSAIAGSVLSHATGGSCALKNLSNDLGNTFVGGQVYPINTISYYVRTGSAGQPSLYRRVNANSAEELVEGIEQMTILYGEDTDATGTAGYGIPNYYVSANNVVNMERVVSIRITLSARTLDDNLTTTADATTGDHRIRRTFTSTIAVRNRL